MGQRANLLIVENGSYDLYYSHECAYTLPRDIFWGPAPALEFIRTQERRKPTHWLNEATAEGGVLVDTTKRVLLLFAGGGFGYDVPRLRYYLRLLGVVWEGWDVRWVYEGIADLADYVRYPREKVVYPLDDSAENMDLDPPQDMSWISIVGSVAHVDGTVRFYPVDASPLDIPPRGTHLLAEIERLPGMESLSLDEWGARFPIGGFHVDIERKSVEFWFAAAETDPAGRVARQWPGWSVVWHRDRYEFQVERAKGLLRLPPVSVSDLEERLRQELIPHRRPPVPQPMQLFLLEQGLAWQRLADQPMSLEEFLREAKLHCETVERNWMADHSDEGGLPRYEQERILDAAFAAARGSDNRSQ